ncbi:MAG: hypothetical protein HZA20_00725 [Nitrospirae bacterium]|nr:hypothetical protein [Nitrospirota bacterium]
MSKAGVKRFLELMDASKDFAGLYTKDPKKAVEGFDLTDEEKAALVTKEDKRLEKLKLKLSSLDVLAHRRY